MVCEVLDRDKVEGVVVYSVNLVSFKLEDCFFNLGFEVIECVMDVYFVVYNLGNKYCRKEFF